MKRKINKNSVKEGKKNKFKYFHLREYKNRMSNLLFKRIIRILASGDFDVIISTKTKGEAGYIDYEKNAIYLNPKLFPVEETVIHEVLHILKPELDERSIIELSSLMFENLDLNKRDRLITYIKALATKCIGISKSELYPTYY